MEHAEQQTIGAVNPAADTSDERKVSLATGDNSPATAERYRGAAVTTGDNSRARAAQQ